MFLALGGGYLGSITSSSYPKVPLWAYAYHKPIIIQPCTTGRIRMWLACDVMTSQPPTQNQLMTLWDDPRGIQMCKAVLLRTGSDQLWK